MTVFTLQLEEESKRQTESLMSANSGVYKSKFSGRGHIDDLLNMWLKEKQFV
jgi:hypothetical protein